MNHDLNDILWAENELAIRAALRDLHSSYCGARSRMDLAAVRQLGRRWVVQPKIDGMFVWVHLDAGGCVCRLTSRSGRPVSSELAADLLGQPLGAPFALLAGELEAHTEAANRIAAAQGYRALHLFDCVRGKGGQPLFDRPYRERRDALYRMHSEVLGDQAQPPAARDATVGGRHRDQGTGRLCRPGRATVHRLAPIVPQVAPGRVDDLWGRVETGDLEGVVVVNLEARIGASRAKRKVKPTREVDAVVVDVGYRKCTVHAVGCTFKVAINSHAIAPGAVVEVSYDGWYESSATPRFARIRRVRTDLTDALH